MRAGIILGFLGLALIQPIQTGQAAQTPKDNQQIGKMESPPHPQSSQPTESGVPHPSGEKACNDNQSLPEKKASYWKEAFGPSNLSNWLLMLVGIGAVIAAFCTLEILKRQTKAAEDAAKAALLNAQVFINAERPWILVRAELSKQRDFGHQVMAVNKGRSPAEVLAHADNCTVIGIMDFLPDIAEYGKTKIYPSPQIILPEESVVIGEITESSLVGKNQGDITRFRNAETQGYVYGSLIYRDLLGPPTAKPHETRWCFSVMTCGERELLAMEFGWGGNEYTRRT